MSSTSKSRNSSRIRYYPWQLVRAVRKRSLPWTIFTPKTSTMSSILFTYCGWKWKRFQIFKVGKPRCKSLETNSRKRNRWTTSVKHLSWLFPRTHVSRKGMTGSYYDIIRASSTFSKLSYQSYSNHWSYNLHIMHACRDTLDSSTSYTFYVSYTNVPLWSRTCPQQFATAKSACVMYSGSKLKRIRCYCSPKRVPSNSSPWTSSVPLPEPRR